MLYTFWTYGLPFWMMIRANSYWVLTNNTCQGQCQILNITFSHQILTSVSLGGTCCHQQGFPGGANGREPTCQCRRHRRHGFYPWVGKIPWRRPWQPTPVLLPGEPHGQRNLAGYSPWSRRESYMAKGIQQRTGTMKMSCLHLFTSSKP